MLKGHANPERTEEHWLPSFLILLNLKSVSDHLKNFQSGYYFKIKLLEIRVIF